MADTGILDLTDGTTAAASDRIYVARDPTGTPLDRYITPAYIKDYILGTANTFTALQTLSGGITGASNVLSVANSTNAQTVNIYNTVDSIASPTDYETGFAKWVSNVFLVGTGKGGTGTARALGFRTNGTTWWTVSTAGVIEPTTNDAYDIGSSSLRPRLIYSSSNIVCGRDVTIASSRYVIFAAGAGSCISSPSDGVIKLSNNADNAFTRLQFGGTTSSFPALTRSTTTLQVKLADDSAFALLESLSLKTQAPSGGTSGTWKLGVAASVSPTSPDRTIEVDIGGTIYYIHAKTTNN